MFVASSCEPQPSLFKLCLWHPKLKLNIEVEMLIIIMIVFLVIKLPDLYNVIVYVLISRYSYEEVEKIAQGLLNRVKCRPRLGIICGSGLGGLANMLEDKEEIPYAEIDGFPVSTGIVKSVLSSTVKPVLSSHSKIDKTKVLKTGGSLMQVVSVAECSLGAFCNTFDLY